MLSSQKQEKTTDTEKKETKEIKVRESKEKAKEESKETEVDTHSKLRTLRLLARIRPKQVCCVV